jgi:hypothetical protein
MPLNEVLAARSLLQALTPAASELATVLATLNDSVKRLASLCDRMESSLLTKNLLLGSLLDARLELRQPLPIRIEYDGHQYVAKSLDLDLYGVGDSDEDALDDLRLAVAEYYVDLKQEHLGDHLARRFAYLASIIAERRED